MQKRTTKPKKHKTQFLVVVFLGIMLCIPYLSSEATVGVSIRIKEVLIFEVITPSQIFRSTDQYNAQVTTPFNIDNNPVYIRARICIPQNQIAQLQVQANGDLVNSQGLKFPVANVAWKALGSGFNDGIMSKDSAQIMATWKGPGIHQGTIIYYFIQSPSLPGDYIQTITYTLVSP